MLDVQGYLTTHVFLLKGRDKGLSGSMVWLEGVRLGGGLKHFSFLFFKSLTSRGSIKAMVQQLISSSQSVSLSF